MYLRDILHSKGCTVFTIAPDASCDDAARELVRLNIGSLVVRKDPHSPVRGIITERDVLRLLVSRHRPLEEMRVLDVLTRDLVTARPDDHILFAMVLMTRHEIRHLPIFDCNELCGLVSIGDIVKAHHDELESENYFMRSYIRGDQANIT